MLGPVIRRRQTVDKFSLRNHGYLLAAIALLTGLGLILSIPLTIESHQTFSSEVKSYGNGMYSSELIQLNSSGGTIVVSNPPGLNYSGLIQGKQLQEVNLSDIAQLSIKPNPVSEGGNGTGESYYYENLPTGPYYFVIFGNYSNSLQFYWTYLPFSLNYQLYGGWGLVGLTPILFIVTYLARRKFNRNM